MEEPVDQTAQRRRYRLLIAMELCLLLVTVLGIAVLRLWRDHIVWTMGPMMALLMWHVIVVPICFLYLIGKPVVMTLSPLIPSRASRRFRRELRQRPPLDDDEFYSRFYEGSEIAREVPARVRRCLLDIDPLVERMKPSDLLPLLDDELDFGDVFVRLERALGFRFANVDCEGMEGTLDDVIRLVNKALS